jgi:cytochrome c-type biogenesis protein CcmH
MMEARPGVLLWVILACLTAVVLLVLRRPVASMRAADPAREASDAAVYRDQLGEVESDRERGLIGEAEAEAARIEIGRRLLATDARDKALKRNRPAGAPGLAMMLVMGIGLPALALGLYFAYGSPHLPDQPLALRLQDPASDKNLEALVARVEAGLRDHPEEGEGWEVIAPVYMGWSRYIDAADAYSQAIRLLGESPKRLSGYGRALVLANDGVVTEEGRRPLERALALDPDLVEPRILLTIAKEQDGRFKEAIDDWRALLAKNSDEGPWRKIVEQRVAADEARLAGKPEGVAAAPDSKGGPSSGDVAAANDMSPAERQAMIERMVQGLAARLEQKGDDLGGWLKLVRAYSVLDRKDDAVKALARAKTQFTGDAKALEQLDALASELGLKS